MFKRLFSRTKKEVLSSTPNRNIKPMEHNRGEMSRLIESIQMNNPDCDVFNVEELQQKFNQFVAQNKLGTDLKTDYISHCSPEKLQRLLESGYYGSTIKNGIKKIEASDHEFSWSSDKDVVGSLFMDRGFFILVRAVNRKSGFTRRWVFDMYLATKNFA